MINNGKSKWPFKLLQAFNFALDVKNDLLVFVLYARLFYMHTPCKQSLFVPRMSIIWEYEDLFLSI